MVEVEVEVVVVRYRLLGVKTQVVL